MEPQEAQQKLQEDITQMEELLRREEMDSQRSARWFTTLTIALLLIVVGFVAANYLWIRHEFTEENLTRSLEKEMREFSPAAMRELGILGEHLLPVYASETRKQIIDMGPAMAGRFKAEIDQLGNDILVDVQQKLDRGQTRVLARLEKTLFDSYPSLHDPKRREAITENFRNSTERSLLRAIGSFHVRFAPHVDRIREAIEQIDVSDTGESELALQKKFLRLWLQLLDQEIMEM